MELPNSAIDPATAPDDKQYVIAFEDDDWDHWSTVDEANTYRGWRENGRWRFTDLEGGPVGDWSYDDDEIIVLREL